MVLQTTCVNAASAVFQRWEKELFRGERCLQRFFNSEKKVFQRCLNGEKKIVSTVKKEVFPQLFYSGKKKLLSRH